MWGFESESEFPLGIFAIHERGDRVSVSVCQKCTAGAPFSSVGRAGVPCTEALYMGWVVFLSESSASV